MILPSILKKFEPWFKIIETENIGSYKKFISALNEAKENEVIISLDDDFIYPSHLIFSLYSLFLQNKGNALIAFNGRDYTDGLGGGLGILWNPHVFNPSNPPIFFLMQSIFGKIWVALVPMTHGFLLIV